MEFFSPMASGGKVSVTYAPIAWPVNAGSGFVEARFLIELYLCSLKYDSIRGQMQLFSSMAEWSYLLHMPRLSGFLQRRLRRYRSLLLRAVIELYLLSLNDDSMRDQMRFYSSTVPDPSVSMYIYVCVPIAWFDSDWAQALSKPASFALI